MKDIIVVSLSPAIDRNYTVYEFLPGKLFRCENPVISPGGKGVNVARIISLLGGKVSLVGFFAGNNGQFIVDNLKNHNVDVSPIYTQGETRSSINILDKVSGRETEILEKGPEVSMGNTGLLKEMLFSRIEQACENPVVIFSGGIPDGVQDGIYGELIAGANKRKADCFLDSSGEALIKGVDAVPFFAKPNIREFSQIADHIYKTGNMGYIGNINFNNVTNPEILRKIIEISKKTGIRNLVISLSGKGALLINSNRIYHMIPPEISAVNTIGSGDSFTAGFAYAYSIGKSGEECMKTAGACGASNALFEQVGIIDPDKVSEFAEKTEIKEIII